MPRYIRKPKARLWWEEDEPFRPNIQVDLVPPERTGVLDADGVELVKIPDQIGFLRKGEKE
jgi:hypothetical protein